MPFEAAVTAPDQTLRPATPDDAPVLARLINHAGEGLPLYFWEQLAQPGESAWDVGCRRAARDEGGFSYRNAVMAEHRGQAVGALIGYGIAGEPSPIGADMPALFRPLQELENLALGTWYINVLAVLPGFRGRGLGTALLRLADAAGRALGKRGMSLIVSDANGGARRLYERCGYAETAARPMVKEGWANDGRTWVLLTRPL